MLAEEEISKTVLYPGMDKSNIALKNMLNEEKVHVEIQDSNL